MSCDEKIIQSKILILSSFTHPDVWLILFVEHIFFFFDHTVEHSGNQNVLVTSIFQNIIFCAKYRK